MGGMGKEWGFGNARSYVYNLNNNEKQGQISSFQRTIDT